jgi:hypothetical protein
MTHGNGILFYETTVFSEIDCDNFIQNMKIKFDELATKNSNELKGISNHYLSISCISNLLEQTINCNALDMYKYYCNYKPKDVPESRDTVMNTLYAAEYCLNYKTKRADKIVQRQKRSIIFSTKSGLFWNSDIHSHDKFLNNIKLPLYL